MKYLSVDYGARRVGVAVSDAEGKIAFPRTTLPNDEKLLPQLIKIIADEKIGAIVVGDTLSHGGRDNPVTAEADAFVTALQAAAVISVERVWEMWSSIEASRYAPKGEEHNNEAAAAVILQRYLEMKGGNVE
jgi:putative Holliday junction resolvase